LIVHIGVTLGLLPADGHYAIPRSYCDVLSMLGAAPLLLPPLKAVPLRALYDCASGLLLSGGGDLSPSLFGQQPHQSTSFVSDARDAAEMQLTRWALQDGKPVLGICRGIQTLNVAAGGDLIQDIPSLVPRALPHQTLARLAPDHIAHPVLVDHDSLLATWLGQSARGQLAALPVNSRHHQSLGRVAPGFGVVARAPDGVIEAIEYTSDGQFALGVQWHPENMVGSHPAMRSLFEHFVAACRR